MVVLSLRSNQTIQTIHVPTLADSAIVYKYKGMACLLEENSS